MIPGSRWDPNEQKLPIVSSGDTHRYRMLEYVVAADFSARRAIRQAAVDCLMVKGFDDLRCPESGQDCPFDAKLGVCLSTGSNDSRQFYHA